MTELLVGCGSARDKRIVVIGEPDWKDLVTLDITDYFKPDVVWDLNEYPYPFEDNTFSEIHAYEVLEHLGHQGDYKSFFRQFTEFWRILKSDGILCATVPWWEDRFAWADPGHARVITPDTLAFLSQRFYKESENTVTTDYRYCYEADFEPVYAERVENPEAEHAASFWFALKAVKE